MKLFEIDNDCDPNRFNLLIAVEPKRSS